MGSKTSKQIVKQQLKAKYKREVESMYKMFDETIDVVKKSRLLLSDYDRTKGIVSYSKLNQSKINNLDDVLEQLLSSFKSNQKYSWGIDIYHQFKKHFTKCFQDVWPINKEQFYLIILEQCRFQTLDFQHQLEEVALQTNTYLPNRKSYQKLFFQVGAQKIQGHLPSSIIDQSQEEWSQDFSKQCEEQKALFNLNAINATIINGEYNPKDYLTSYRQKKDEQQQEDQVNFLPLFLKTEQKTKSILKPNINKDLKTSTLENNSSKKEIQKIKKIQKLQDARIQNSSLIMPQTIFLSRMSETAKQQISDLVKFYKQFGNALQRLFFSISLISSPFKHFIFIFNENMKRKNIKHKTLSKPENNRPILNKQSLNNKQMKQLLYGESKQAIQFRHRRQTNNNFILDQIRDFTQAYAQFIWKYLQLSDITQLKLGKMISIQNLYGIVLKSVWNFVNFISDRGYQYEQWKIQQYYENRQVPNRTTITQQKKRYLLRYLKKLKDQHNPQKYLKKVVIFYRQASACGTCADDLLNIYQELIIRLIKNKVTRQIGLFRMRNVIERVLKIDQTYSGGGQIGYSWTTWYILTEMLRERISGVQLKKNNSEISQMQTEPDQDFFYEEDLGIN